MILDGRYDSSSLPPYHRLATASFGEPQPFRAVPNKSHLVLGSFHPPSGVLFGFPSRYCVRYRSRDVFRVGSWCLPASDAISKAPYSGSFPSYPARLHLRGFHPLRHAFPCNLGFPREGLEEVLQLHIPSGSRHRVRFALHPLRSPLLRVSLLLSPPPGTKMFQFPGFPFAAANDGGCPPSGSPIQRSRVQRLLAPSPSVSPLATTFFGARAKPSPKRLSLS